MERRRANRLRLSPDAWLIRDKDVLAMLKVWGKGECLLPPSLPPPRCRGKLTLFGSGMITYPLFVQCPSDASRSLPAFAFISNTCARKKLPVCRMQEIFSTGCFSWQKGSWTWQKTDWGISPLSRVTCSESWRSSTTAPTPSPLQVLKGHVRADLFFFFIWYLHRGVTEAQLLWNTSGI